MTARDPYLNNMAYIEFNKGMVLTGENKVDCDCGVTEQTSVTLYFQGTKGKDYMITTKVSPKGGNTFGLDLSSNGFHHSTGVYGQNHEVKIILSPQYTGQFHLSLRCFGTAGTVKQWTFHSLSVKEVN
jgi:hypothetical protein